MDKFCVITNRDKDTNLEITTKIVDYMSKNQKECILLEGQNPVNCPSRFTDAKSIPDDTECAIVLGGDGTIIQAANDLAGKGIANPIGTILSVAAILRLTFGLTDEAYGLEKQWRSELMNVLLLQILQRKVRILFHY